MKDYDKVKAQWAKRREMIRRWYRTGMSLRTIAAQLDISVQRVHKIVTSK